MEELLQKLKDALKKAGLKEELSKFINITSEDQIEGVVASLRSTQEDKLDFERILGSKEFSDFVNAKGFDAVLKASKTLRSEHDKKVTSGVKTFKDKYFKKLDTDEDDQDGDDKSKGKGDNDTPAWAKALMDKVDKLESEKTKESKLEQAKTAMSKSKLPEKLRERWISRVNLESDKSFEDQIKDLEEEAAEFFKDTEDKGLPMGGGSGGSKVKAEEAAAIVEDLM